LGCCANAMAAAAKRRKRLIDIVYAGKSTYKKR
jgi:hypothetical protein